MADLRALASARRRVGELAAGVLLLAAAAVMVFPFVWMILSSLKSSGEISSLPPTLLPEEWLFGNYTEAWNAPPGTFGRYYLNSVILALGGTAITVVTGVLAAFAFAYTRSPGRGPLFALFLGTMMVPPEVKLIPNFVVIRHLPFLGGNDWTGAGGQGLYDSYLGMMVPGAADAFYVFLLRQAFLKVPPDYYEAARVDGASRLRFLWTIALPMIRPALGVVVVLSVFENWNSLLWPLVVTQSEAIRPVQVGLLFMQGEFNAHPELVMAAATLSILPIVLLYFLAQRQFQDSIVHSGLRG